VNDLESALIYTLPRIAATILCGAGAVAIAYRHRRAGWLGIPLGAVLTDLAAFATIGLPLYGYWDWLPLAYGALVAGFMGWRLPRPDSLIALLAALPIAYATGFLLDTRGADNPAAFFIAASTLGFLIGAIASAAMSLFGAWRLRRAAANG
jgi:hypothetical protein